MNSEIKRLLPSNIVSSAYILNEARKFLKNKNDLSIKSLKVRDVLSVLKIGMTSNEIKELFSKTVVSWFKNKMLKEDRTELFKAIWSGDAETITDELCGFLDAQ